MTLIVLIFITYSIVEMFKIFCENSLKHFLPIISAIVGSIIGSIIFVTFPEFRTNDNFAISLLEYIISGLASTGLHQLLIHTKLSFTRDPKYLKKNIKNNDDKVISLKDIKFDNSIQSSSTQQNSTDSKQ